jgi:two-component system nitrogen regulation sensor histidine kinase NtrY
VPIAVRLLVALGLLALFVTALVGYSARDAAKREVERGFAERMESAASGARDELGREAASLGKLLGPQCEHDSMVDAPLVELERAAGQVERLGTGRRIAVQRLVSEQRKALGLDELLLVAGDGIVLGASDERQLGRRRPDLGEALRKPAEGPRLAEWNGRAALEARCARTSADVSLGLVAYREIAPILKRIGGAYGVTLSLPADAPPRGADGPVMRRQLRMAEIPGLEVTATISERPRDEALRKIDRSIVLSGGIALLLAIALAVFMAGGLSRPIVQLAHETREILRGKPRPVRAGGGREIRELARSFNQTIEELATTRRRLAVTERIAARREVARHIAHEIKNPLAPIRAAVETLRRLRARGSPEFDRYFEEATATVLTEVHRIAGIVSEFTKFARLPPPKLAQVDVEAVARSVVGLHDGKGITGAPRVALKAEPVPELMADRDQLVQVLTNLVQNGIEAARGVGDPPGMPRVEVVIVRESEHTVCITVRDNGPGVAEAMRERLFEPYASTKPGGTGLGLAIAQRIVFEHGGEIRYADAPGGGASFAVVLPIDGPPPLERPATDDAEGTRG